MPSIWKRQSKPEAALYQFPDAGMLVTEDSNDAKVCKEEPASEECLNDESTRAGPAVLNYAETQAEQMLRTAREQAEKILEQARGDAKTRAEAMYEEARKEGWEAGHAEGILQGTAEALEENRKTQEKTHQELTAEVKRFLEQANAALDRQMNENIGELRDLAIAVAEKVISISLKSSSEVVGRMIQSAVDKRKRREWVRIYVAESDAKQMIKLSPALAASLSSLSDRVRIIPLSDDEAGTCIIEMPDEIIDASVATQISNIKSMLNDFPTDDEQEAFGFEEGAFAHVPPHDSSSL